MPVTPQITIAGSVMDLFGDMVGASLVVQLCGYGSEFPRVAGTALVAPTAPIAIAVAAGSYSFKLWGNDVITPSFYGDHSIKTFYTVQLVDGAGNTIQINSYQFTGNETVDLSSAVPYTPPDFPPAPPIPTYIVFADTSTAAPFSLYIANGQIQVVAGGTIPAPVAGVVLLDTGNADAPVTIQITNGVPDVVLGGANGVPFLAFNDVLTGAQWKLIMILSDGLETPEVIAG
jgi:hypothetical protein